MNKVKILLIVSGILLFNSCQFKNPVAIVIPEKPSSSEMLSAKEIRRYTYMRTGILPEIIRSDNSPSGYSNIIAVADRKSSLIKKIDSTVEELAGALKENGYILRSVGKEGNKVLVITGKDETGVLYGAYAFAEKLGVRFYLHGDVVPEKKIRFSLPDIDEKVNPLFGLRGIQPFHDFPEGPDWWSSDDYKAVLNQLVKLKMNFIGFHTYPQGGVGPEPLVWIGLRQDINDNGTVNYSYPARHFTTVNGTWGYLAKKTDDYYFNDGNLFERSDYGPDYMVGMTPWPENKAKSNELFSRTGKFFGEVFTYAKSLGIKTCVGTETPLKIPDNVKERLKELKMDPESPSVKTSLYEGMFEWIRKNYPVDYYWLWTPEDWTWGGNKPQDIENTKNDILIAYSALKNLSNPFSLATCGWVLGPKQDRSMFDRILPGDISVSCISRNLGVEKLDSGFFKISGRSKWAIPWMEDDPGLSQPQMWAGRMMKDAHDAYRAGCAGLMGIHWRTRELGPNVNALAVSAWEKQSGNVENVDENLRDMPVIEFYTDWAMANFGEEIADSAAQIFSSIDGVYPDGSTSSIFKPFMNRYVRIPRAADWINGPGAIRPDTVPWVKKKELYSFVDKLEALRPMVTGKGNLERFDTWLNSFRYLRAAGKMACATGEFEKKLKEIKVLKDAESRKKEAVSNLLPVRKKIIADMEEAHNWLLASVTTSGGLGTISNWQQHIASLSIEIPGMELDTLLAEKLSAEYKPGKEFKGNARLMVPTVRSDLAAGEDLRIKIICIGFQPEKLTARWKQLGNRSYREIMSVHVGRGVYEIVIPAAEIKDDFEYYISARDSNGRIFEWPATAGEANQSVVIN
jgi:hypothetical protein